MKQATKILYENSRKETFRKFFHGLSFEEACRRYALECRPPQYISDQPVEVDEVIDGRREHYFQTPLKRFLSEDPAQKHCYSREELIAEAARVTGLPEREACFLLYRLFSFQPELTYNHYGALCKKYSVPRLNFDGFGTAAIPYATLAKELPKEWYISLQIPEEIISRMVWSCRKAGRNRPHPCSHRFAEQILRLYQRRRGEFIQNYSFETLKFFWLEFGSMQLPRSKIEVVVREFLPKNRV